MPITNKEPKLRSSNKYIRPLNTLLSVVRSSRISLYSGKYSRRTYTQHQHLALILLKEMMRMDYRSTTDLLEMMRGIRDLLELKQIPHFNMPQIEDLRQLHQKMQLTSEILPAD